MASSHNELLFGVVFCSFAMIVCAVRAHREKDRTFYLGAIASFLMLLVCVFLILNQRFLAIILFACAGIFAIVTLPKSLKLLERIERKSVELAQVNLSAECEAKMLRALDTDEDRKRLKVELEVLRKRLMNYPGWFWWWIYPYGLSKSSPRFQRV